jgi:hypothetical protein
MELNDIYFCLICFAALVALAVMLNYYVDLIEKDDKE